MLSSHCVCFFAFTVSKVVCQCPTCPYVCLLNSHYRPKAKMFPDTQPFFFQYPFFPWASIWAFDKCGSICWWDLVVHKGFVGGWLQGLMITFSPLWLTSRPAWWCFLAPPVNLPARPSAAIQGHLVGGPLRDRGARSHLVGGRFKSTPRWFVFSQGGGGGDLIGQIFQILPNILH